MFEVPNANGEHSGTNDLIILQSVSPAGGDSAVAAFETQSSIMRNERDPPEGNEEEMDSLIQFYDNLYDLDPNSHYFLNPDHNQN